MSPNIIKWPLLAKIDPSWKPWNKYTDNLIQCCHRLFSERLHPFKLPSAAQETSHISANSHLSNFGQSNEYVVISHCCLICISLNTCKFEPLWIDFIVCISSSENFLFITFIFFLLSYLLLGDLQMFPIYIS